MLYLVPETEFPKPWLVLYSFHSLPSLLRSVLNSDTKVNLSSWNLFKDTFKVSIGPVGIGEGLSEQNQVRQWVRWAGRIWEGAGCWIKASRILQGPRSHRSPGKKPNCLFISMSLWLWLCQQRPYALFETRSFPEVTPPLVLAFDVFIIHH